MRKCKRRSVSYMEVGVRVYMRILRLREVSKGKRSLVIVRRSFLSFLFGSLAESRRFQSPSIPYSLSRGQVSLMLRPLIHRYGYLARAFQAPRSNWSWASLAKRYMKRVLRTFSTIFSSLHWLYRTPVAAIPRVADLRSFWLAILKSFWRRHVLLMMTVASLPYKSPEWTSVSYHHSAVSLHVVYPRKPETLFDRPKWQISLSSIQYPPVSGYQCSAQVSSFDSHLPYNPPVRSIRMGDLYAT